MTRVSVVKAAAWFFGNVSDAGNWLANFLDIGGKLHEHTRNPDTCLGCKVNQAMGFLVPALVNAVLMIGSWELGGVVGVVALQLFWVYAFYKGLLEGPTIDKWWDDWLMFWGQVGWMEAVHVIEQEKDVEKRKVMCNDVGLPPNLAALAIDAPQEQLSMFE